MKDNNKEKSVQQYRPLTTCNVCNIRLREDRLERHLQKVHHQLDNLNNNNNNNIERKIVKFTEVVAFINQEKLKQSQQQILKNETPEQHKNEESSIQSPNQLKKSPWREEKCQRCNTPIYIHKDWRKPLFFCKECTAYRKKARTKTSISDKKIKNLGFRLIFTPFETNRQRH